MSQREVPGERTTAFCHEREKDSARKGSSTRRRAPEEPAGVLLRAVRSTRRFRDARAPPRGRRDGALTLVASTTRCARNRPPHCNDCMKGCIFQNRSQHPGRSRRARDRRARASWGVEITVFSQLLNPRRPFALPTTAATFRRGPRPGRLPLPTTSSTKGSASSAGTG